MNFFDNPNFSEQLTSMQTSFDIKTHLDVFKNMYPSFDLFQESVEISEIFRDENNKKAVYRFKNSEMLKDSDESIYHFYIACGILEAIFPKELNREVICNVEKIHLSKKEEGDSYVDLSLEFK